MRRLMLLRHSTAERASPGESDQARPLTAEGHDHAAMIGAYLASHAFLPDRVLVSPATRARETWRQIGPALRSAPEPVFDPRIYNATPKALLAVIAEAGDRVQSLMLIGHNPGLHELAMLLIATGSVDTRERLRESFPTSGVAIVDFPFDSWRQLHARSGRLERFVSPKLIAAATN